MRKIVETFVKYPFYANLIVFILVVAGGISFASMSKAFFPERESKSIFVTVSYPGASPIEMEEGITSRVEEAIRGIAGIKEITSTSSENLARVTIETTGKFDIDETLTEVKNAVDGITSMPVSAERPIVFKRRSTTPAMRLGLSGNMDLMELKQLAYEIEDDFLSSGYMSQLSFNGIPATEISIEISEENLIRYGITLDQVSNTVRQTNRDVSSGIIKNDDRMIYIRSRNRTVDTKIIENTVIKSQDDGAIVRIKDVGKVKLQFEDVPNRSYLNGKPAISIMVNKLITEDLQDISEYIDVYVEEFNALYPNAELTVSFDFMEMLNSRISLLYKNGLMGLLLVVIVLALFLSFRLSLWVAWGIPASFLAMFIVANLYGLTINMISLFGMILVIGIIVDDGIVIAENIFSHFERGKSPHRAAIDGTMEVLPAVTTSVTTTILAFMPLFFIIGNMEFLFEMAFVVVFSLAFSLIEAFFVLPAHISSPTILKRNTNNVSFGNRVRNRLEKMVSFLRDRMYGRFLKFILKWRYPALAVPSAAIMITAGLFAGGLIKSTFFPSIPPDDFNINVAFTPGEGEKQTYEALLRFEQAAWDINQELKEQYNDTSDFIIYTYLNTGSSFSGEERGTHAGHIAVNLRNLERSPVSSFEIATMVRKKIGIVPGADKFTVAGRNRWGSPIEISLLSNNQQEIENATEMLKGELKKISVLTEVVDNNALGAQEIKIKLKPKAYFLGLNDFMILNQVRSSFFGSQAQRLQQGKDEMRVWVRYPPEDREQFSQLEKLKIVTAQGEYPLKELVDYEISRGPVSINRFNGKKDIRVKADLVNPTTPVPPIQEYITDSIMPKVMAQNAGIRYIYQGQQKNAQENMDSMKATFIPAFALIIIIIMIHFKSVGQGFIIITMIPLGFLGAAWGHLIHGLPVSMLSVWGMVALSGVIVNDAVVFLSKYNILLKDGKKVYDAIFEAGVSRFRPIVLTTLTTTIGLYPIILETSRQAQYLIPMAIALAYGVFFGTFFILTLFPVMIYFLNDVNRIIKWVRTGVKPSAEEVESAIIYAKRELDSQSDNNE
ncbi:efflux RND transporter permease subunit [Carboxylicivirga sp. N1Y90]|uniref:efflux RND transporter permease subunit n=1 Tax=Carboxylicivirga fragile TaxID=3417571 RepID=UPI003D338239|nr:efflux RND transporter permease subunit [Marinilabiliaceae bacterium N1Y90]